MYCTTELYLSVDKRKKTTNKEGTMLVYNVYVMYILSRVENWEYLQITTVCTVYCVEVCVDSKLTVKMSVHATTKYIMQQNTSLHIYIYMYIYMYVTSHGVTPIYCAFMSGITSAIAGAQEVLEQRDRL